MDYTIRSEVGDAYLTFTPAKGTFPDEPVRPMVSASVSFSAHGVSFQDNNWHVWFWLSDVNEFVDAVTKVAHSRNGTATLASSSPGEFSLSIATREGHVPTLVEIRLKRHVPLSNRSNDHEVSIAFELSQWKLEPVAEDCSRLLDEFDRLVA